MTNHKQDRDATVDRLLAGAMTRGPEAPAGACLDAETLAAWADGALDAGELAAAEAHAADCARCQAMVAAMAKTAPIAPSAAATWWRPSSLRWLVPLAAAAAAVVVWIVVPARETGSVNVREVSQTAEGIPPPSETPPRSLAQPASPSAPVSAPTESRLARREQQTPAEAKELDLDKKDAAPNANASGASARADLSRRNAESAKADLSRRSADGAKADASLEKSRALADSATAAPAARAPAARAFSFGAPETVVVSPNPASRWRILQGGAVQRSSDGGATWQTQNTGVSETLSAGSSPSPSVCWLVGPGGIVLLSTDGQSWKRLAFPEAVHLSAIRATDSENATVTTADGRQFVTEDGGRTWTRAPGL